MLCLSSSVMFLCVLYKWYFSHHRNPKQKCHLVVCAFQSHHDFRRIDMQQFGFLCVVSFVRHPRNLSNWFPWVRLVIFRNHYHLKNYYMYIYWIWLSSLCFRIRTKSKSEIHTSHRSTYSDMTHEISIKNTAKRMPWSQRR